MTDKIYPNTTFEKAARDRGARVQCLWQIEGPDNTTVAWIECISVNGTVCLVQTYDEGGWEVYTPNRSIDVGSTISDALARCGLSTD